MREYPTILPDGLSHDWSLEYQPGGTDSQARITVALDQTSKTWILEKAPSSGATFDRFGIVTSWIDGNGQLVYWDDVTYTVKQ